MTMIATLMIEKPCIFKDYIFLQKLRNAIIPVQKKICPWEILKIHISERKFEVMRSLARLLKKKRFILLLKTLDQFFISHNKHLCLINYATKFCE
jgi:hypothetical protein